MIRKVAGSGGNSRIFSDSIISASNNGVIRPISDNTQLYDQNNYGKEYNLYCEESIDIKVGDLINITVPIGKGKFNVMGLSVFEDLQDASDAHQRVRINKSNANSDA